MRRVAVLLAIFAVAGFGVLASTAVAGHSCHGGNPWCSRTTTTTPITSTTATTTTTTQSTTTAPATTTTAPTTTTSPTTTTTPPPSGSVLFDGRATKLTSIASHEVCSTCGYNVGPTTWPDGSRHYWYQSTASDPWRPWDATHTDHGCFCFINDDISLSPDAL